MDATGRAACCLPVALVTGLALWAMTPGAGAQGGHPSAAPAAGASLGPDVVECELLHPQPGWPVWLKDYHRGARTDETSGMAYAGRDRDGARCFFLADDVGFLHCCRVIQEGDTGKVDLRLERVEIHRSLIDGLADIKRWDFESLSLDPAGYTGSRGVTWGLGPQGREAPDAVGDMHGRTTPAAVPGTFGGELPDTILGVLSVEGHGENFLESTRVVGIRFVRNTRRAGRPDGCAGWQAEFLGDAITGARFWRGSVGANRGIEGLALTRRLLFLGLESLDHRGEFNTTGTVLYVYNRETGQVAQLSTRPLGIHSICGMEALSDSVTVLIDRNRQAISVLRWDAKIPGRVLSCHRFPLDLPGPGGFRYAVASVEGLTVDAEGGIWCVTDPWHGHYHPMGAVPESVRVYLAAEIPMIYRFPGEPVWEAAGLGSLWGLPGGGSPMQEEKKSGVGGTE